MGRMGHIVSPTHLRTALRRRSLGLISIVSILIWVAPTFLLAILIQELQVLIYGRTGLVVAAGFGELNWIQVFWASVVLGLRPAAYLYGQAQASLEAQTSEFYARTALAKGLSYPQVVVRHLAPAALSRLVVVWLNSFRLMVGALPLVEFFFGYPGLGRILIISLGLTYVGPSAQVQTALAFGLLFAMGAILVLTESLTELVRIGVDPRLRRAAA